MKAQQHSQFAIRFHTENTEIQSQNMRDRKTQNNRTTERQSISKCVICKRMKWKGKGKTKTKYGNIKIYVGFVLLELHIPIVTAQISCLVFEIAMILKPNHFVFILSICPHKYSICVMNSPLEAIFEKS